MRFRRELPGVPVFTWRRWVARRRLQQLIEYHQAAIKRLKRMEERLEDDEADDEDDEADNEDGRESPNPDAQDVDDP